MKELRHLDSMIPLRVEKVETLPSFLNADCVFVRPVFKNQLLQVQERPLVWNFLSDLNNGLPGVLGRKSRAIRTLAVQHDVFDLKYLL